MVDPAYPAPRCYVLTSQFPELSETFIAREVLALEQAGLPLEVVTLKRCRDPFRPPECERLRAAIFRPGLAGPAALGALVLVCGAQPLRALRATTTILARAVERGEAIKVLAALGAAARLARRIRRAGGGHVHAHWSRVPATVAWWMHEVAGIPYSLALHGENVARPRPLLGRALARARFITACHDGVADRVEAHYPQAAAGRVLRWPHGLSPPPAGAEAAPPGPGEGRLLCVGRLVEHKGFARALEALALLRARDPARAWRLELIGEGPLAGALRAQAARLGLDGRVEWRGARPQHEVRAAMARAHLLLVPSVVEAGGMQDGIPNALLEALQQGLPAIASDLAGPRQVLAGWHDRGLVPPGDATALAEAIRKLVDDADRWRRCAAEGRARAAAGHELASAVRPLARRLARELDDPPLRVLHVIEDLGLGGGERALVSLLRHRRRDAVQAAVCCLSRPGELAAELPDLGVPLAVLGKRPGIDPRALGRLRRLVRAFRPDVLHGHMFTGNAWGRIAAWCEGVSVRLATEQSVDTWKDPWRRRVDAVLARASAAVIAVSPQVARFYQDEVGVPAERLVVLPNPIEPRAAPVDAAARSHARVLLGLGLGAPVVGFVGRLVEAKDPLQLPLLLDGLVPRCPGVRLVVVGGGPLAGELARVLASRGHGGRALLLGPRRDVGELLPGFDVLVSTSRREGSPVALGEALLVEVPVAAYDVGGVSELVRPGETGELLAPGDTTNLARAVSALLADPPRRRRLGVAGRALVERRFLAPVVAAELEALYRRLLAEQRAGGR